MIDLPASFWWWLYAVEMAAWLLWAVVAARTGGLACVVSHGGASTRG